MPSLYAKKQSEGITPAEIAACRRVADYLRRVALPYLADIYAEPNIERAEKRNQRYTPFVEFYITFYPSIVARFDRKMVQGIREFAAGHISPEQLKAVCDEYIEAHTVVWLDGVPHWKVENLK
jgi:hypothetical protein